MNESFSNSENKPNKLHINLYEAWANGGTGVSVTGNVMVDRNALGEPGNVVIDDERDMDILKQWVIAGTKNNTHLWMQINHPGKQSPKTISKEPVAPSAIPVEGKYKSMFNTPRALTITEIKDIINKFINTAKIAKKAGFTGVQIHAAHGYLVSQFLSPHDNRRTDEYGGNLENRMRFLIEIYKGMRNELGNDFPISLKINSSDFKYGGFNESDSIEVVKKMSELGIDLIEISGGNYENPKMFSETEKSENEIFFIDYARKIKMLVNTPIVITGGFRSKTKMEEALINGETSMIGIARPLAIVPDIPNKIINENLERIELKRLTTGFKKLDNIFGPIIGNSYYAQQMKRIGQGKNPKPHTNAWSPIFSMLKSQGLNALLPKRVKKHH